MPCSGRSLDRPPLPNRRPPNRLRNYTRHLVFAYEMMVCAIPPTRLAATPSERYNPAVATASKTIPIKVLFFGRLKEIVGRAEDSFDVTEGASIEDLFARYRASNPELANYRSSLVASRNQEFAPWTTPLQAGDEVAFLPPVSGG
jgi:molybdopterin synthase sulfur carrier subunit